jgi:hypothetical protein
MSQPIQHLSVILTADERAILLAFLNSGMKADVNAAGLSTEAGNIVQNAIHLARRLQEATPVQQLKVTPAAVDVPSADVTDPAIPRA